jgi:Protein of unknown function (DUF3168)
VLFEEAFFQQLVEADEVARIVGDRVFPVEIPQFKPDVKTYPAVVYQVVARARIYTLDGVTNTVETTVSVSCLSVDYMEAKRLADAVRRANAAPKDTDPLSQVSLLSTTLQDESDNFEYDELEEASLFHVRQTYFIRHVED